MSRVCRHLSALLAAVALLQPPIVAALVDCASQDAHAHVAHAAHPAHATPSSSACEIARDECGEDRPGESCESMVACQTAAVAMAPTIAAAPGARVVERPTLVPARYAGPELPPDDPPPRV